jgi:hypothetical protein
MKKHQVTFDLNPRVKVILSVTLRVGAQSKPGLGDVLRMEGVIFAQDRPEGFLVKVEGETFQESVSRATKLREKFGAQESLPLTTQFVPRDFQSP